MLSCVRAEFFLFRFEVARLSVTIRLALNLARLPKEIVFLQVLPSVCVRVLFMQQILYHRVYCHDDANCHLAGFRVVLDASRCAPCVYRSSSQAQHVT